MKKIITGVFLLGVATRLALLMAAGTATHGAGVDLSTPKAALEAIYGAMRVGDIAGVKSCLLFEDAEAAEIFEANAAQVCAPLRLMRAMEDKFGVAARKPFDPSVEKSIEEAMERIKHVDITVTGDVAVVAEKKGDVNPNAETELSGVTLKRIAGKWKIVASTFPDSGGDMSPKQLALLRSLREALNAACQATITRLERGDFHSAEEAYAAYQALLQPSARAAATAPGVAK